MALSLSKGNNINLTKEAGAAGLSACTVGLGWDARTTDGDKFDLDASAIVVGADGKVLSDGHFVFYGQTASSDGSVSHGGDNRSGEGAGDDETIKVSLANVPAAAERIVILASIYESEKNGQTFGQVRNAYCRVVNEAGGAELGRYDLTEDASSETAMVFGELYRNGADWKFRAVGQGYASGLAGIARDYGVNV